MVTNQDFEYIKELFIKREFQRQCQGCDQSADIQLRRWYKLSVFQLRSEFCHQQSKIVSKLFVAKIVMSPISLLPWFSNHI